MYWHHAALVPSLHAADGDCEGGLPVAAIEMAATGLPLVASDHCDLPELVDPDRSGWIFPAGQCERLVEAIILAAADVSGLSQRSEGARRIGERKFDLRSTGERLEGVYDEAVFLVRGRGK